MVLRYRRRERRGRFGLPGLILSLGVSVLWPRELRADDRSARVTEVVRQVEIIGGPSPRPAVLKEALATGNGLRTGDNSRAELTFTDLTITRVGANTIYSYQIGGRTASLSDGAVLLRVPKNSGGARITSNTLTVGITGTTLLLEYHPRSFGKLTVLEGTTRIWLNKNPSQTATVHGGQMLEVKTGASKIGEPVEIDLDRVMRTNPLITQFSPLPSEGLIRTVMMAQPDAEPGLNWGGVPVHFPPVAGPTQKASSQQSPLRSAPTPAKRSQSERRRRAP